MRRFLFSTFLLLTLVSSGFAAEFAIHGVTDKDVAIYKVGEKIEFTFKILEDGAPVAGKKFTWERSGDDGKNDKGEAISSLEGIKVVTTMDKPGFVRIQAKAFREDGKRLQGFKGGWGGNKQGNIFFDGGACVEPEKLKSIQEPADFDEFWKSMKETLAKVPLKPELKELEAKNPKMKLFAVTIPCAGPKPVTGYLSYPANAEPKSLPAKVKFHGYGVRKHNPPTHFDTRSIVFDINAHGLKLGDDEAYKKRKAELKNYAFDQNENSKRTTSYFYGMSLRVMRALEFAKSLPQWDGKTLESNGGSQGGLQALWGAGLDPDVTSSDCWSPWCCDLGGVTLGRIKGGWRVKYHPELNYYDPVFHAKRMTGKIHLIVNYGDYVCPPSSLWVVYNNIPHDNKSMQVKQGCTHSYAMKNHKSYNISPKGVSNIRTSSK